MLLGLVALAACAHAPSPARPSTPAACTSDGNIAATSPPSPDEPVLVMYERDAWASGFDLPALVIWGDGTVAYGDAPAPNARHLLEAHLAPAHAAAIADAALSRLRRAPPFTSLAHWSDGPSVVFVVRDGGAWRYVEVYGLERSFPDTEVPDAMRSVVATYRQLLTVRPPARGELASAERPRRWPAALPAYRGQIRVDQVVRCFIRSQRAHEGS
jgi:hypothetical protein